MKEYRIKETIIAEIYHGAPGIINTSIGAYKVKEGDYLIHSNNEIYPLKPDIFKKIFEEVK